MTGTSCDGADLALLEVHLASGREKLVKTASRSFPRVLRDRLRQAQTGGIAVPDAAVLNRDYSRWLARFCDEALRSWQIKNRDNVVVSIHGQTIWHAPKQQVSVQLLDPAIVAHVTGCTVAACFRQPDLTRGGEGAPLVPLYHWMRAMGTRYARELPFAIHNVGGIANLTYIARDRSKIVAFDTGPGNALIDLAVELVTRGKQRIDRGGKIAASALDEIEWKKIETLGKAPYFRKRPPKSTGREYFNRRFVKLLPGKSAAIVANATAFTAHTMAKSYVDFILKQGLPLKKVYVAGGGARNPVLVMLFQRELVRLSGQQIEVTVLPDDFAPAQMLEAMAFARLGLEALRGSPVSLSAITGASEDAFGAGIFPGKNFCKLKSLIK